MPAMIFLHHTPRGVRLVLGTSIAGRNYTKMKLSHPQCAETQVLQQRLAVHMRDIVQYSNRRPTLKELWDRVVAAGQVPSDQEWKFLPSSPTTPTERIFLKGSL